MTFPSPTTLPSTGLLPSTGGSPVPTTGGRVLTALGIEMRDSLPPVLRDSPHYLGVINALSRECERLAAKMEVVRAQLNPGAADLLLGVWERIVRETVEPGGESLAERRAAVTARLRKMLTIGEGSAWEEQVTALIGPGWTYTEHIPGDATTPEPGILRIKLPFPPEGSRYLEARDLIREVTPAHLEIELESGEGFLLDESDLDLETMPI
jgi:hypothetical protein